MPLTVNVSVSRKLGRPNYASLGASCGTQIELDPFVFSEPETLHEKIQDAFEVCRRAVDEELSKADCHDATYDAPANRLIAPQAANGNDVSGVNGRGPEQPSLWATDRQVDFLHQLARQIGALGSQRLRLVAEHRFGHSLDEITASEASGLIDLLKEVRSGARPVADLLPEAAA
jgi:hypothetical protein